MFQIAWIFKNIPQLLHFGWTLAKKMSKHKVKTDFLETLYFSQNKSNGSWEILEHSGDLLQSLKYDWEN